VCPTNPLAGRDALDLQTYLGCRHATVTYGGSWRSRYLLELDAMGARLNEVLQTPSPAGLAELIRDTPLVATVPARLAQAMRGQLAVVASPVPAPFDIDLIWTERTGQAGLHRWIREELVRACRTIEQAPV
jgi:DNA-binding transcriptional LysR family regulator